MAKKLGFAIYLLIEGVAVPWEELSEEQKADWRKGATERLSQSMSDYYTQHPEEFARL